MLRGSADALVTRRLWLLVSGLLTAVSMVARRSSRRLTAVGLGLVLSGWLGSQALAIDPPTLEPPHIEPPSIDPPRADAPHMSASDAAEMSMTRTVVGTTTPAPTTTADSRQPRVTVRPHQGPHED